MKKQIEKILLNADYNEELYSVTADKILSLMDENKNRLANEVRATEDFDGI